MITTRDYTSFVEQTATTLEPGLQPFISLPSNLSSYPSSALINILLKIKQIYIKKQVAADSNRILNNIFQKNIYNFNVGWNHNCKHSFPLIIMFCKNIILYYYKIFLRVKISTNWWNIFSILPINRIIKVSWAPSDTIVLNWFALLCQNLVNTIKIWRAENIASSVK